MGAPRLVVVYVRQKMPKFLDMYVDGNHAGCTQTRRSTSCTTCKHGAHWIKSSTTTQIPIALSSGESEFHAVVKGTSSGIGLQVFAKDLGAQLELNIHVDATAGIGIASRRGIGKIRHLDTSFLWVQKCLHERRALVKKVLGTENPADLGTKVLAGPVIWKLLKLCGIEQKAGVAALALKAAV